MNIAFKTKYVPFYFHVFYLLRFSTEGMKYDFMIDIEIFFLQ